MSIIMLHEA